MGSARETLLLLANNDDMPGFITILKEQITKRPKVDMAEIITELSRKQQKPIWEKMKAVADKLKSDVEPQNYVGMNLISDDGAKVLQCLSSVIISVIKSDFSDVEDIVPSCSVLYDIIKFISNKDDNVSSLIYSLGEIWWNRNLAGRDKFAKPTIMFLLQKSLLKSIKADVKRVYAMRECLRKISLDDGDACQLIKCATSSLYLKVPQGRKFIAFLMTLSSKLLNMIHGAIKSKLLQCNSVEANSYGEIYVRAWDSMPADGDLRQKIELDCIQDVMYNCIHAPTSTLASTLRKVLCPLHNQRQNYDVGKLLVRLYGPILWRALKVVNSAVRCNAAAILLSTFPLEDPDLNRVELDKEIQTQLNAIEELLYDPSPSVRCVAVMGTYQICNLYWELIPVNVIKSLLTAILENLAFDASSPKVRLSVFKGLIVLLENPLSHAYVGELLMRVQKCFHDLSENVRVVFMEVLLSVKSLKTVKYWKITPPDELLCRLAVDTPPVARRIVSLLFSSYHPISKGDELLLERSISLIMANRQASRCFYRYAHKFMDLKNSVHYILLVNHLLLGYVKTQLKNSKISNDDTYTNFNDDSDDENVAFDGDASNSNLSLDVIGGLLDATCIVWHNIKPDLENNHNKNLKKTLDLKVAKSLSRFFKVFKGTEVFDSVLYLSSFMPPSIVQMQKSFCMSRLRAGIADNEEVHFTTILECMCNWAHVDDVFEIISDWLEAGFECKSTTANSKTKKLCRRGVHFQESHKPQPQLALEYLAFIIQSPVCRNVVVNYRRKEACDLLQQMRNVQRSVTDYLSGNALVHDSAPEKFLSSAFLLMCELSILLHNDEMEPNVSAIDMLSKTMDWVENHILSKIVSSADCKKEELDANTVRKKRSLKPFSGNSNGRNFLPMKITENFVVSLWNIMTVTVIDVEFLSLICNFLQKLLDSGLPCEYEDGDTMLKVILFILYQMQECSLLSEAIKDDFDEANISKLFEDWIRNLSYFDKNHPESSKRTYPTLKKPMVCALKLYQKCALLGFKLYDDIMATLMVAALTNIAECIYEKSISIDEKLKLNSLSSFSSLVLSAVTSTTFLTRRFVKEIVHCLESQVIKDNSGFAACAAIFSIFFEDCHCTGGDLKEGILTLEGIIKESLKAVESSANKEEAKKPDAGLVVVMEVLQELKKSCSIIV